MSEDDKPVILDAAMIGTPDDDFFEQSMRALAEIFDLEWDAMMPRERKAQIEDLKLMLRGKRQ